MKTGRKKLLLVFSVLLVVSVVLSVLAQFAFAENVDSGKVFNAADGKVKYKVAQSDVDNLSAGKGLLLYSYDSGAKADFGMKLSGAFNATLKSVKNPFGTKDLSAFSVIFTDETSGKSFAVRVAIYSDRTDVCVEYDGKRAGIVYYSDDWTSPTPSKLTALANEEGRYTSFEAGAVAEIQFDPSVMTVSAKLADGAYHTVWDFRSEYNYGKRLTNDLQKFGNYGVAIKFDEIAASGRGDILVYSFGGYSFGGKTVARTPSLCVDVKSKAIVGTEYDIPDARVYDPVDGVVKDAVVTVAVYDAQGKVLNDGRKFAPTSAGTYYIYYSYVNGDVTRSIFYALDAIDTGSISEEFVYDKEFVDNAEVGINANIYIPDVHVTSTLSANGSAAKAKAEVIFDGKAEPVQTGTYFACEDVGEYTLRYYTSEFGRLAEQRKTFTVSEDRIVAEFSVDEVYTLGDTFTIPIANVYVKGVKVDAKGTVVFPSGKQSEANQTTLNEEGKYTLRFAYSVNGSEQSAEKTFLVKRTFASVFEGNVSYDAMTSNNEIKGVKVSLTNTNTVTFNKAIDLSKYRFDNSLTDLSDNMPFIKIYAQPHSQGFTDVDALIVTLTDAHDPSNYLTIRMKYISYFSSGVFIRTRASNQTAYVGYCYDFWSVERQVHAASTHEEGGFQSYFNLTHSVTNTPFEDLGLPLYFDYQSSSLYSRPAWLTGHDGEYNGVKYETSGVKVPWLVYDYSTTDSVLSASNKPWQGFTNGEVYLSLSAKGVSSTADFFVVGIDGNDLSERYIEDNAAPVIDVKLPEGGAPVAKQGLKYKVFDFDAYDAGTTVVKSNVTVQNSRGTVIPVDDNGYFVPEFNGKYTLIYTATDAFGNTAEKRVEVTAKSSVPALELQVDQLDEYYYGQRVTLPDVVYGGGSGALNLDIKVVCDADGTQIPTEYGEFVAAANGESYTITYTLTDYIGQSMRKVLKLQATRQDKPIFDKNFVVLPTSFVDGEGYTFGKYTATYYAEDYTAYHVEAKIRVVNGQSVVNVAAEDKYTPDYSAGTNAEVQLIFDKDGKTETVTYNVPIVKPIFGKTYMQGFFTCDNAEISADINCLNFVSVDKTQTMKFAFVRRINARSLLLRFVVGKEKIGNGTFNVTLADVKDAHGKIDLTFKVTDGDYKMSVNGSDFVKVNLDGEGYLQLLYDADTRTITDGQSVQIAKLTATSDGRDFDGFTENEVYLSVSAEGVDELGIRTINNQTINNVRRDSQEPYVYVDGMLEGRYETGVKVVIPAAEAYDVLSSIGDLTVKVLFEGKEEILSALANKQHELTFDKCGSYEVVYSVTDATGQVGSKSLYFTIGDSVKPTLTFDKKLQERAKAGATITLPTYTADDNLGADNVTVRVYVTRPDGRFATVSDGKYTFDKAGWYTVTYFAIDSQNNSVVYSFDIQIV